MNVVKDSTSTFQSRKSVFLSVLVLSGLLTASIWGSVKIISTYVYDNRVTLVSTVNIEENDTLPYLENLYFELNPVFSLLFPQVSDDLVTVEYFEILEEEVRNGSFSLDTVNVSNAADRLKMIAILSLLDHIDSNGIECARNGPHCTPENVRSRFDWLANFVRDLASIADVVNRLWSFIQPNLIRSYTAANQSDFLFVDTLITTSMLAELVTSRVLKGNKAVFGLHLGFFIKGYGETRKDASSTITMEITTKSTTFPPIELSSMKHCQISLQINNVGVFDKSGTTTACESEEKFIRHNGEWYPIAWLENFVRQCGCVPFAYKRHYFTIAGSNTLEQQPPTCDIEAYYQCTNKTIAIDESSLLPPCRKSKNQYQFSVYCTDDPEHYDCEEEGVQQRCPMATLSMISNADFYAVYAERFQLTPTQFVSQLGGEIGLYTGLSVLSIWQLLLYLHKKYSKFHSVHEHLPDDERSVSVRVVFYKAFAMSLFKTLERSMVDVGGQDEHPPPRQQAEEVGAKSVEQRLSEIERKLECVDALAKSKERLETGLETTNQKLEHLESIAMKTQQIR